MGMDWMFVLKLSVTSLTVLGAITVVLGFPGTFLGWLGLVIFSFATRFAEISGWTLLGTFVGCLLVELADNLLAGILVKRFGASEGSMLMAWVGGLGGVMVGGFIGGIGGFLGSALLGVVGAFAGSYAAVYFWERNRHKRPHSNAARAAFGTVLGRLLGIALKLGWIGWLLSLVW